MLDVQSARDLESETVIDLTRYLCSACSCQVKQQNPGFDLLCEMNWDERLFEGTFDSAATDRAPSLAAEPFSTDAEPTLVTIPSGHASRESPPNPPNLPGSAAKNPTGVLLALGALAVAAALIAITRR